MTAATHDATGAHCSISDGYCGVHHSWRCGLAPRSPAEMRAELRLAREALGGDS